MNYYQENENRVLEALQSGREGLSGKQAQERLERHGPNKLQEAPKDSLFLRFLKQMNDPMTMILIAAAVLSGITSFYSGESFADVIIIMAVVLINAGLGVYQEGRAEKAIEELQQMAASTSRVLRDGNVVVIKSEELVPGDVVLLEAGDAVPADARLIECVSLKLEEAALTGESLPVEKSVEKLAGDDIPLGDRKNMVYLGSTVVYGHGRAVVTGTGMNTEMGKIAGVLAQAGSGQTPLQRKLSELSKILTFLVLGICVVIFGFSVLRAGKLTFDSMIDLFMVAVSLAVAAIPEGLATVVTIVLSIGVTNMSKRNAIIRRLTAVETLGCAQIICSDKTGTLTQNKMTVTECYGEDEKLLATAMALCCDVEVSASGEMVGDPTEVALVAYAEKMGLPKAELTRSMPRVAEAPFDSVRKMMSTVHSVEGSVVQFTKGAPDIVLSHCTSYWKDGQEHPMTEEKRREILAANKAMADKALRVLAVALRRYEQMPSGLKPETLEEQLCFVGLAGMIDPIRPEVKDAIVECREAGIRPVMITGDHLDTAVAIAKELGILTDGLQAMTGSQLSAMDDDELLANIEKYAVYARVQPEHKVRIVDAWRYKGYVTAMTGDGVNDAPSRHQNRGRHGAGRRQLCHHRGRRGRGPAHLRQHPQGHPVFAGLQHERGAQRLYRHHAGLYHPAPCTPALDQPDYRLLPRPCPWHRKGGGQSDEAQAPQPRRGRAGQGAGGRCGLPGRAHHHSDADGLFRGTLYGVRRLGNRGIARRHHHGLFDHEHGRDFPQLQHEKSARQHLLAVEPQQGALAGLWSKPAFDAGRYLYPPAGARLPV